MLKSSLGHILDNLCAKRCDSQAVRIDILRHTQPTMARPNEASADNNPANGLDAAIAEVYG